MKTQIGKTTLSLTVGDITKAKTGAIVNAANSELKAGSGVCGAILDACGWEPFNTCKKKYPDGIATGQAIMTKGGKMPYAIIHAVGPVWNKKADESRQKSCIAALDAAYWNSLVLADDKGISSVSFPSLSTGIFGFPTKLAAQTAIKSILEFIQETKHSLTHIQFILFSQSNYETYSEGPRRGCW